jgi:MFS family permease
MGSTPGPADAAAAEPLGGRTAWIVLTVGQLAAVAAVIHRSSLGVASAQALERFGITAATLASFVMVQLLVYAALQVPVGVLIDRYGSTRLVVAGTLLMAGAQAMFAAAQALPLAFAARVLLGVGDALTFISVMRLIPAWFPSLRSGRVTNATGQIYQVGFLLAALAFGVTLAGLGWTPAFLATAAMSLLVGGIVLVLLRDSPHGRPVRVPLGRALGVAAHDLGAAWAEPGTRMGFWVSFVSLFAPMMFGVMWGYPFLTAGQGLSAGTARLLMGVLAISAVVLGPLLGVVLARYPIKRSLISLGVAGVTLTVWTAVLVRPDPAPMWLLVVLVAVLPANSVTAVMAFDLARNFNPARRLGTAIGLVNVGGFLSTLIAVIGIGVLLDVLGPAGSTDYPLAAYRSAFTVQYLLWGVGAVQVLRYRRRTIRALAERDPQGYAALRRGIPLAPPT